MDNMNNGFPGGFDDPFGSAPASDPELFPDPFGTGGGQIPPESSSKKRGLHWIQTIVVLIVTAFSAFLLSCALNIRYSVDPLLHPHLVLFNGLYFALLAAAILITVFLIELATSAMTPHFSRKLQLLVALIAILLCGLVGALGEFLFVQDYILPQIAPMPTPVITPEPTPTPTPTPSPTPTPTPTPAPQPDEVIIIALDKSSSMNDTLYSNRDSQSTRAVTSLLSKLTPGSRVGLITFSDIILGTVPIAPNSAHQQQAIADAAFIRPRGTTDFANVIDAALTMFRKSGITDPKKLIFITDGEADSVDQYLDACASMDLQVSAVMIDGNTNNLQNLVAGTNGIFATVTNLDDLLEQIAAIAMTTPNPTPVITPSPTPSPSPTPVPTPSPTPLPQIGNLTYVIPDAETYLAAILILEGLIIGLSLTLMLSLKRQFRIQLILSPLMGLCAFLLIRYRVIASSEAWAAYTLLGIVLMRRNDGYFNRSAATPTPSPVPGVVSTPVDLLTFDEDGFSS